MKTHSTLSSAINRQRAAVLLETATAGIYAPLSGMEAATGVFNAGIDRAG